MGSEEGIDNRVRGVSSCIPSIASVIFFMLIILLIDCPRNDEKKVRFCC